MKKKTYLKKKITVTNHAPNQKNFCPKNLQNANGTEFLVNLPSEYSTIRIGIDQKNSIIIHII